MSRAHCRGCRKLALLLALLPAGARAATYYVAPDGKDSNPGSESAPFASWGQAQTAAAPGDTVYFRGGRYRYTAATSACTSTSATVDAVALSKSGTSGNPIHYWAYPGEKPVFDFSGITDTSRYNCRQTGVRVTASWLHLKGLELTGVLQLNNLNHESWCVYVYGGSNNVFEQLDAHHNMGPGFFIQRGGNNTFLNCDSHENEDTLTSNGDGQSADGFGCHPNQTGDTGNVFRGCRAWWNTDDGWDFINASAACTVESSWSWYNGYKPDAIRDGAPVSLSSGNGNGFKGGGYGMPPSGEPSPIPQHVVRFDVAFFNKAAGFYANHSPNSPVFYNNTGYKNSPDFDLLGVASDGSTSISVGILRNNLAYGGTLTSNAGLGGGLLDDQYDSWDASLGLTVANGDFQSVAFAPPASCPADYVAGGTVCVPPTDTTSFAGMASARQADGSLPVLPFLRLAASSGLIDKGHDVGLPFAGKAPDLGAFEYGAAGGTGGTGGSSTASGGGGTGGSTTITSLGTGGSSGQGGTVQPGGTGGTFGATSTSAGGSGTGRGQGGDSGASATSGGTVAARGGNPAGGGGAGGDGPAGGGAGGGSPAGGGGVTAASGGHAGSVPIAQGGGGQAGGPAGGASAPGRAQGGSAGSSAGHAGSSGCSCQVGAVADDNRGWWILFGLVIALRWSRRARSARGRVA